MLRISRLSGSIQIPQRRMMMSDMAEILQNAPRECWLALDHDERKVLGRGENMEEAVREAKEQGEDDPVLIWAPRTWTPGVY